MIDDHRKRRVVDLNRIGAINRRRHSVGHDDGHRLPDIAHLVDGEGRRLDRLSDERRRVLVGHRAIEPEVGGGVHPTLAPILFESDRVDQGMSLDAPHEDGMHHPGHTDVIDVSALAGDQSRILDPADG